MNKYRIRKWLIKNEVFFNCVSIGLAIATFVSTILIAVRTEVISKNQMTIERKMSNPVINCEIDYNKTYENIESVDISVTENPIDEIDIRVTLIYCIRLGMFESNKLGTYNVMVNKEYLLLPIAEAKKVIMHNTNVGDICTIEFLENDEYLTNFKEDSPSIPVSFNSSEITSIGLAYFIEVKYVDVLGEPNNKIYFCKPNLMVNFKGSYGFQTNDFNCSFFEITNKNTLYEFYKSIIGSNCVIFDNIITIDEDFETKFVEFCEKAIENNQFFQI